MLRVIVFCIAMIFALPVAALADCKEVDLSRTATLSRPATRLSKAILKMLYPTAAAANSTILGARTTGPIADYDKAIELDPKKEVVASQRTGFEIL